jgi:hypothetical protein
MCASDDIIKEEKREPCKAQSVVEVVAYKQ